MQLEILQRVGLTPGEAKIYLALLELGQSTTGPIVNKSKVSTSKTYKILERLENKGLVSHIIKRNIIHWSAANPKRIYDFFDRLETKKDNLLFKRKFLFGENARGTMPFIEKSKFCEVKYLHYSSIVSINIYGETSFISIFSEEPIFFVIKSKEIADSFLGYFKLLWKIGNK